MCQRKGSVGRSTKETEVSAAIVLDGSGACKIETGLGFFDHMLNLLGYHSKTDLEVKARGDLHVDDHHLVEDVGIVLGKALDDALGDRVGIERYGWCLLPMDEVLVAAAVDLGGRYFFSTDYRPVRDAVGGLSTELIPHFFNSLALEARLNLHLRILEPGANEHHRIEAMFKAVARALRMAVTIDSHSAAQIPSTKGVI